MQPVGKEKRGRRRFDLCDHSACRLDIRYIKTDISTGESHLSNPLEGEDLWESGRQGSIKCALCLECISGLYICCEICGHGGHAEHLSEWFSRYEECPTGCSCRCSSTLRYEDVDFEEDGEETYMLNSASQDLQLGGSNGLYTTDFVATKHVFYDKMTMTPPLYFQEISLEQNYLSRYNYNKDLVGINIDADDEETTMATPPSLDSN
jgi:hypothetical protein